MLRGILAICPDGRINGWRSRQVGKPEELAVSLSNVLTCPVFGKGSGPEPTADAGIAGQEGLGQGAIFLGLSGPPSRPLLTARTAGIEALGPCIRGGQPGPEPDSLRHLHDYRANIFARNFILSTKSTFVGWLFCASLQTKVERVRHRVDGGVRRR